MTFLGGISSSSTAASLDALIWNQVLPGFNPQTVIDALMASYDQPITNLQDEQQTLASQVSAYQQVNTDVLALQSAAQAISSPSDWGAMQASSSDSAVASATASSGAQSGSTTFTVDQLATADVLLSSGAVSSTSSSVTSATSLLLSQAGSLGFSALAGSGLTLGSHTLSVTQASQAATATGSTDLQTSGADIASGSNTLDVTVNGTAYTLTITPGNYTSGSSLVAAVNSAISAAGLSGSLQAGLSSSGQMVLATVDQGSSQSLQVTGGGALSALGLSVMSSAASGANAVVNVDGTSNTLTTVAPGSTYTLSSGSGGSISATVEGSTSQPYVNSSLVSVGSISAQNVSTGNGSLADVVQAINSAGVGFSASAVQTSAGYQLELTASATGSASDITIAPGSFASTPLGTLDTAIAGSDAQVSIGGASGPVVSSPTNSLTGLLAGVTIDLHSVSSSPVTVTVSSDAQAMATKVQAFVNAANQVLSDINSDIGYNAATKTGGPLMGSAALQNLQQQILSLVATAGEGTSLGSLAAAGVTLTSNGTMTQLAFNKSTFDSAYAANPSAVQALFAQGGTFAPSSSAYTGQVSLLYAGSTTQPGTYSVNITQSATQATDTGTALSAGSVSAAETLSVATGGQSIAYSTYAGESLQSIASGLNQAFSGMGMALNAQVNSSDQLQILSDAYGSSATFTVSSTNTASGTTGLAGSGTASFTGTNVAGTIDGMAATGNGQSLTASSASPLGGMVLEVTTPGITSSTNIGSFTYTAGAGQDYVQLANQTSNPTTGQLGYVISGLQQESTALNPEIANYQQIANQEQQMLQNEFSQALSVVSSLHSQGSYLSQFISATGL